MAERRSPILHNVGYLTEDVGRCFAKADSAAWH
jgi:hypothetical protein